MDEKRKILVFYGYHIGEDFAKEVGIEFGRLNLKNTVVMRLKGERHSKKNYDDPLGIFKQRNKDYQDWKKGKIVYPEDLSLLRRKVGAKYGIDLHDCSPSREWMLQHLGDETLGLAPPYYKYDVIGHMEFEKAKRLVLGFKRHWNRMRGIEETSDHDVCSFACDCYYETYRMRRLCRANIIELEYYHVTTSLTIEEGVNFLKELVVYLQSFG